MSSPIITPGRRLELGQAMSAPFKVYKRGFGAFVASMLMPMGAAVVVGTIGSLIAVGLLVNSGTRVAGIVVFGVTYVVMLVAATLLSLKSNGMIIRGTFDIVQGDRPGVGDLWRRTPGVVGRMLVLTLLVLAAVIVVGLVLFLVMGLPLLGGLLAGDREVAGAMSALGSLFAYIVLLAIYVGVFYLSVKLMFLLPEVVVGEKHGIPAAKASWQLTRGRFWRLLGYSLLFSVIMGVIVYAIEIVGVLVLLGFMVAGISAIQEGRFPASMIVGFILFYVIVFAGAFLVTPLSTIFNSLLYAERISEGGAGQQWGQPGPGQPGPWGQPGQPGPWGQPSGGFEWGAQQGAPQAGQGWQQPGQGWQQPGQPGQQPGQGWQQPGPGGPQGGQGWQGQQPGAWNP